MKKTWLLLLLAFMLALSACGPQVAAGGGGAKNGAFPVTVTDAAQRTVTIEKEPQTIVSAYYISSSMVIALGQKDKVVGIEAKAASRPIYKLAAPDFLNLPSVGTAKEFDLEGCAALKPDLVILPYSLKDAAETLESIGIAALVIRPEDIDSLKDSVGLLAKATGAEKEGQALVKFIDDTLAKLETLVDGANRPTVFLGGNSSFLSAAGSKMYQHTLIERAGGQNVAGEIDDDYWVNISYEQLIVWNPHVIILPPGAKYSVADIQGDANLQALDAVKNGRIYQMPSSLEQWDSPIPGAPLGSLWLMGVLHPDLYSAADFFADAKGFYQTFYGLDLNEEDVK